MLKPILVKLAYIYVPAKRRTTLDSSKVAEIAESILETGQTTPILVREDGERFVLVEGLDRLEACSRWARKPSVRSSSRLVGTDPLARAKKIVLGSQSPMAASRSNMD